MTTSWFRSFAVVWCVLLITACGGRGGPIPYSASNFGAPDAPELSVSNAYRIGASDTIGVSVFNVPEYSGDYVVDDGGKIQLPLVGDVAVASLTSNEAAVVVTKLLAKSYLRSPVVQVVIKSPTSRRVTVDGAVTAPGVYAVGGQMTLLQVIAQAKGTTDSANPRRTVIFRTIGGKRMAAAFDLTDIRRGVEKDPEVFANDIVVVDGSQIKKNLTTVLQTVPLLTLFRPF